MSHWCTVRNGFAIMVIDYEWDISRFDARGEYGTYFCIQGASMLIFSKVENNYYKPGTRRFILCNFLFWCVNKIYYQPYLLLTHNL